MNWIDPFGLETIVIITKDPLPGAVGWYGSHAAVYVDNNGDPAIYDPAGSYGDRNTIGSGDIISGPAANWNNYMKYHMDIGSKVALFFFATTAQEEAAILNQADEQGGGAPFQCAILTSSAISGIGPFKDIKPSLTPDGLYLDMRKLIQK